jgi:hypothetical protein
MWDAILASVPAEPKFKPPAAPVTMPPPTLAHYTVRYKFGPSAVIPIGTEEDKLTATLWGAWGVTFYDLHADQ